MNKMKCYFVIIGLLILTLSLFGCAISPTKTTSVTAIKTTKTTPPIGSTSVTPIPKTVTSSTTPIPKTISSSTPPFTANIITVNNYFNNYNVTGVTQNGVLFFNNTSNFVKLSCTVRQHDADGNYLSDYDVASAYIPPNAHLVTMLPPDVNKSLTINNLKQITTNMGNDNFIVVSINNIHILPMTKGEFTPFFAGTVTNTGMVYINGKASNEVSSITPNYIDIQILMRTPDGSLTLAGAGGLVGSTPMPPPNESVKFSVSLWQDITIKDAQKAIIDGEITVVAWQRY